MRGDDGSLSGHGVVLRVLGELALGKEVEMVRGLIGLGESGLS